MISLQRETKARQGGCIPFDSSIANLSTSEVSRLYMMKLLLYAKSVPGFVLIWRHG